MSVTSRRPKQRARRFSIMLRLALLLIVLLLAMKSSDRLADAWRAQLGGRDSSIEALLRLPSYGLQFAEWRLQNFIHSLVMPEPPRSDVVVLGIDSASMEASSAWDEDIAASKHLKLIKEGWPWSREVYAEVIDRVLQAGAKAVMVDLVFNGPSKSFPEGDEAFKAVLEKHPGKVVLAANFTQTQGSNGYTATVTLPHDSVLPFDLPPIGFVNYWHDLDGIVRSATFHRSINEENGEPARPDVERLTSFIGQGMSCGGQQGLIPTEPRLIHYGRADYYEPLSIHELLVPSLWEGNFKKGAVFKDKYLFIGPAASELQDYHVTPVGRLLGVQVHAHALAAALQGQWLNAQPDWTRWLLPPVAIVCGLALVMLLSGRPVLTLLAFILATVLGVALCFAAFMFGGWVVDGVAPLLGFNAFGIASLAYDQMLARRDVAALRAQLSRYFSPDHAEELMRDPEGFNSMSVGQRRTVVVLFSDVRGFTSMAESRPADELVAQLNEYLDSMVGITFGQRGMIDKFIGDAIMAIWGRMGGVQTDATIEEDAIKAVTTALRMRAGMIELNERWQQEGHPKLAFGLGIHQGEAIVGDIGSISMPRMEFTVIGDSVNTAARLESATKQYGVDVLISDVVHGRVKDRFLCRTADLAKPVGKTIAVPIYTVLGYAGDTPPIGLAAFEEGIIKYRAGDFVEAIESFKEAAVLGLDDKLTRIYLERCAELHADPPANWDGVYVMTKK